MRYQRRDEFQTGAGRWFWPEFDSTMVIYLRKVVENIIHAKQY